jgi:alanyl-tRNA synthetase
MQYVKDEKGKYNPAKQKNVDTGMGVERTLAILNGMKSVYETSTFVPIIKEIEKLSGRKYGKSPKETAHMRIVADHIKASCFIIADGITPSNTERGYVLRRLIRRTIRYGQLIGIKGDFTAKLVDSVLEIYPDYKELKKNRNQIIAELDKEEKKFILLIEEGIKKASKIFEKKIPLNQEKADKLRNLSGEKTIEIIRKMLENRKAGKPYKMKEVNITEKEIDNSLITGKEAFYLYQSFGFPRTMLIDLAIKERLLIDTDEFDKEAETHQNLSKTASAGQFKSGLADNSEQTKKLHTATHLLNEALRAVLKDKNIHQKGSNINPERLRFDFNFGRKLEAGEIKAVENWVNDRIKKKIPVVREEMSLKQALKSGAQAEFGAKYPEIVSVYTIGDVSKEICTGPHASNTGELGKFKIQKEESSAAGIRRIKAVLE